MIWRASIPCQEVSNKTLQLEFGQTAAISTEISTSCHWFCGCFETFSTRIC
jgi:hypothetical protein